jgi:hypothetical protein
VSTRPHLFLVKLLEYFTSKGFGGLVTPSAKFDKNYICQQLNGDRFYHQFTVNGMGFGKN